ncbi:DUF6084 family protein [Streptacidiphilus neutrinimicus]|uniref:DUF6084 family protein n=1 Tax=Streptacidiphilus neutrinimicus TaxID=105420 RepID=UPI000B24C580|nr:DUF6084 family protein [Streptacidiphilus neutrinimicus]
MSGGLDFACVGVRAEPYAVGPTLVFRVRITAHGEDRRVHAIALRCQFRVEPAQRGYSDAEAAGLGDLFGERERWGRSLNPMQFAQASVVVPGFDGSTEVDLPVPCSYDTDLAATRYCEALAGGEVPLLLLFSGTAFRGPGGFQVEPVPWNKEAVCRMPVAVWREMMDQHFPGCGWLRLPRDVLDALRAYRSRHALPSWEAAVEQLLARAGEDGPTDARVLTSEGSPR